MKQDNSLPFREPDHYSGPKRSLILAGGGMRLSYQAGVLKALEEDGLCFAHADGTSGGIFNLSMLLSQLSIREMCERWRSVKIKDFVSYLPIKKYLNILNVEAFGDADGILKKIFPVLGIEVAKINSEKKIKGTFNVCNYSRKTCEAITNDTVTINHLIAGMSLPMFMPGIKINGDWYIDAVWIKDANLMEAVRRGAEEIWLIWAIGNIHEYKGGTFNQYVHMIEMSANGALFGEFEYINELNDRILKGDSPFGQRRPIEIHVLKPEYPLPLDPDLYFNKINTNTLIDWGYADAKNYLKSSNSIQRPSPCSTKMKSQGIAASFRQMWTNDKENKSLKLSTSVMIHDVSSFLMNQQNCTWTANINFPEHSSVCSAYNTTFSMEAVEGRKTPMLTFNFTGGDKTYFFEGVVKLSGKYSKSSREIHIKIFQENPVQSPCIYSSTLNISIWVWLKMLVNVQIYNATRMGEKRKARQLLNRYFFK